MRSSLLVLLLLIGVQAVLNMGGSLAQNPGAANNRAGQQETATARGQLSQDQISNQQHSTTHPRIKRTQSAASNMHNRSPVIGRSPAGSSPDPSSPVVDPKLFSKRHYRPSPRVVFSEVIPSHDVLDGEGYDFEGMRGLRVRRKAGSHTMHRGEYSVCDSINTWVNKTRATDMSGNEVTVLSHVTVNNKVKKQLFYETTCRSPTKRSSGIVLGARGRRQDKTGNSGCRGIDSRYWNSHCTNTDIYVSALTVFKEQTAWRFIRINAACVCVLSRNSWSRRRDTD
ncbi:neurotrophin-7-like isoform X2 [Gambusia affinis]|nr:neurotrophin-7-like isoform X2 [Gambusia affinis]XP_043974434.1 neurotrophin-7-like isoform X2 [Gambusia affinis]XP_043974443.1 neurotrophin-7-like isoform X2 [Gambusia affinis]XP_043974451.1 neurotrophin-7-like isoform X2 [Gambusia affinis]XP_043974459.1 neurotrophin-7-like isoform X2 [Gambusia affinis]